jgi:predicted alpha/beta-fold hydrolase
MLSAKSLSHAATIKDYSVETSQTQSAPVSDPPEPDIPFLPRRFLRGAHLQTIGSYFLSRRFSLPPHEERLVEVEPGVKVLCHCHWQSGRVKPLTILIVHGLEGSSESAYMLGIAQKGLAAGLNVVRMNQRNCGGTDNISSTLYHSGLSQDVAAVARNLIEQDHISALALVGFSMGGNLVLKLAGEWGASHSAPAQFRAVVAVSPALDLAASADALHLPANRLYEYYFLLSLRRRLRQKARLFPGVFDVSRLRGVSTLRQFDDKITAYYCGFQGASDYYARSSASNVVDRIAVPTFILHAANDPFIRILPETRRKILANPNITFVETKDGGHCSFLANPDGPANDGHWAERRVVDFLRRLQAR